MVAKRPGGADVSGESRGEPALWGGAERAEGTAGGGGSARELGVETPSPPHFWPYFKRTGTWVYITAVT